MQTDKKQSRTLSRDRFVKGMVDKMFLNTVFIVMLGICAGLMVSAGVFTVLFVVGLIPRFAAKTKTAKYEIIYEECVIFGSILACVVSVFNFNGSLAAVFGFDSAYATRLVYQAFLIFIGIFTGIFVGCLSIALAEVLDGIPIFARRIRLKMGISVALVSVALGKLVGALVFFLKGFF